jgi:hypothetical protein
MARDVCVHMMTDHMLMVPSERTRNEWELLPSELRVKFFTTYQVACPMIDSPVVAQRKVASVVHNVHCHEPYQYGTNKKSPPITTNKILGAVQVKKEEVELQKQKQRKDIYEINMSKLGLTLPSGNLEDDPEFQQFLEDMDIKDEYYRTSDTNQTPIKFESVKQLPDLGKCKAIVFVIEYNGEEQVTWKIGNDKPTLVERIGKFAIPCMFDQKSGRWDRMMLEKSEEIGGAILLMELIPAIYTHFERELTVSITFYLQCRRSNVWKASSNQGKICSFSALGSKTQRSYRSSSL